LARGMTQVEECLPRKLKALRSNRSTAKKKKKKPLLMIENPIFKLMYQI
jgi:hypothetical protein